MHDVFLCLNHSLIIPEGWKSFQKARVSKWQTDQTPLICTVTFSTTVAEMEMGKISISFL